LGLVLALLGTPAQPVPPDPVQQLVAAYLANPAAGGPVVLALARQGLDQLSPPLLLVVADAYLRAGRPREAAAALTAPAAPPEWAGPGLAWIALQSGDLADAHARYARLAEQGGDPLPRVIVGLLEAANGRTRAAMTALDDVAADPAVPAKLGEVAALGAAYAQLWVRDFVGAEDRFSAVAARHPDTLLTDDARYGAALARFRRGDRDGAAAALQELAGPDPGPARASRDLLNLRPAAILRAGRRRYGRLPFQLPVDSLRAVLDVNGRTLARAALRRVEARDELPAVGEPIAGGGRDAGSDLLAAPLAGDGRQTVRTDEASPARPAATRERPTPSTVGEPPARGWPRAVVLAALVMVLLAVWWRRRARPGTSARGRAGRP